MKKLAYLLTAASIFAACSSEKNGYIINGTIENVADGSIVYLQKAENRRMVKLDSAIVKNNAFTFKGSQDSVATRFITCQGENEPLNMAFYLESGKIKVHLGVYTSSATGTINNDRYEVVREKTNPLLLKMVESYESASAPELTDEQRDSVLKYTRDLQEQMIDYYKQGAKQNIKNYVGVQLLKQVYNDFSSQEMEQLIAEIAPEYVNDPFIVNIKEQLEKEQATAVGKHFTDFIMATPKGDIVKLSDFVGKGKVVLVDFWASWCGPCRREMPNLVEIYKKYKNKGLEIVGVSLDKTTEDWKKGIEQLEITWPQMSDLKYWESEGSQLYAVQSIPHTVLMGADGTILARGLHGDEIEDAIIKALNLEK